MFMRDREPLERKDDMSILKISAMCLGSLMLIASAVAQPAPGPVAGAPPGAPKVGGTVGVGMSAQHRQKQLDAIKDKLQATDDEWGTLSPAIEAVLDTKQNMSTGAGMSWSSSNNGKPAFQTMVSKTDTGPGNAMQEVRDAVDNRDASDEVLVEKMSAVREARQKARA
ncbi:MAG: hypothetical protein H0T11_02920, partial [Chthoniobacterales bacterium]|nr:hypothetical protein [Chthoniobacterales bacterium]